MSILTALFFPCKKGNTKFICRQTELGWFIFGAAAFTLERKSNYCRASPEDSGSHPLIISIILLSVYIKKDGFCCLTIKKKKNKPQTNKRIPVLLCERGGCRMRESTASSCYGAHAAAPKAIMPLLFPPSRSILPLNCLLMAACSIMVKELLR